MKDQARNPKAGAMEGEALRRLTQIQRSIEALEGHVEQLLKQVPVLEDFAKRSEKAQAVRKEREKLKASAVEFIQKTKKESPQA